MELLGKPLIGLLVALLRFADYIFDIFKILAGTKPIYFNGSPTTLIGFVTGNSKTTIIFLYLFLVGIAAGGIFTLVGIIRGMKSAQGKTPQKVFGKYLMSIVSTLILFITFGAIVMSVSAVIGLVDDAFAANTNYKSTIGSRLMTMFCNTTINEIDPNIPKIDNVDIHNLNGSQKSISEITNYIAGTYINATHVPIENVKKPYPLNNFPLNNEHLSTFRSNFPYFFAFLGVDVLLVATLGAVFYMVLRVFDILFLLLSLPFVTASFPVDDGARLANWRQTMMSKLIMAFSVVLSVNIFMLLIGLVPQIKVTQSTDKAGNILNFIFQFFFMICGAWSIFVSQKLIQEVFNISPGSSGGKLRGLGGKIKGGFSKIFKKKGEKEGNKDKNKKSSNPKKQKAQKQKAEKAQKQQRESFRDKAGRYLYGKKYDQKKAERERVRKGKLDERQAKRDAKVKAKQDKYDNKVKEKQERKEYRYNNGGLIGTLKKRREEKKNGVHLFDELAKYKEWHEKSANENFFK